MTAVPRKGWNKMHTLVAETLSENALILKVFADAGLQPSVRSVTS